MTTLLTGSLTLWSMIVKAFGRLGDFIRVRVFVSKVYCVYYHSMNPSALGTRESP